MESSRETSRRDFLTGRAAVQAVQDLSDRAAAQEPPGPLASPRRSASYLMQISRPAMATDFQVFLNVGQHPQAPDAALRALDLVQTLEDQMTVYREHSELMDINRRAAAGPVRVEARLFALLQYAQQLYTESGGAFDITSGPLSKVWGFYRRQSQVPEEHVLQQAMSRVGGKWIRLDPQEQTIQFLHAGLEINVNAVGKGYALDRCGEVLNEAGVANYLLHGGQSSILARGARSASGEAAVSGEAAARGEAAGSGEAAASGEAQGESQPGFWTVALRHPLKINQRLGELRLRDRALGTSGSGTQFFHHQGRRYGHVLDPRSGQPSEGVLSATVLAPTAAEADALSTAFFVMGLDETREYCSRHAEISAVLVCPGQRSGSISIHPIAVGDDVWLPA